MLDSTQLDMSINYRGKQRDASVNLGGWPSYRQCYITVSDVVAAL